MPSQSSGEGCLKPEDVRVVAVKLAVAIDNRIDGTRSRRRQRDLIDQFHDHEFVGHRHVGSQHIGST
jgi:hypothetical protein